MRIDPNTMIEAATTPHREYMRAHVGNGLAHVATRNALEPSAAMLEPMPRSEDADQQEDDGISPSFSGD